MGLFRRRCPSTSAAGGTISAFPASESRRPSIQQAHGGSLRGLLGVKAHNEYWKDIMKGPDLQFEVRVHQDAIKMQTHF